MSGEKIPTAMERLLKKLEYLRDHNDDTFRYNGLKTCFSNLIEFALRAQLEDTRERIVDGTWLCPRCRKELKILSSAQIEAVKRGEPVDDEDEFKRAIPIQLKEAKDEKEGEAGKNPEGI